MPSIRPKVVCLLRNSSRILLIRAVDPHDGSCFLLPPGGGVEFGETLEQAVIREVLEEVGVHLPSAKRLGMFENMFQFAGRPEHELVFVYEAECHEPILCGREEVSITESNGAVLTARWYTLADIAAAGLPLFPEGLAALLMPSSSGR
jgi:ADP-ribose pyrophosphatase YjhB (NUDIX family)